jgi:hypothetical protein
MTRSRKRVVDLTTGAASRPPDEADLHVLRLALDLQVDAMLLTLGAAARAPSDEPVPWRRWVVEDLDAARLLARSIIDESADPPAALGTGVVGAPPDDALDNLIARYSAMDDLLESVLLRPYAAQPWRPAAHEARTRCRARLEELHRHRGVRVVQTASQRPYLPGELLG